MATPALKDVIDALDTYIESANGLEITCIKGYPDFRQPDLSPPIAALFYGGSAEADSGLVRKRVGAALQQVVLTLGVYANNEVGLFSLAAKLQAMRRKRITLTVDSQTIHVYIGDDEREPPDEDAPKELRHLITCPVVVAFE